MAGPLSYALTLNTAAFNGPLRGAQGLMRGFGSAASGVTGILGRMINPVTAIAGGIGVMGTAIGAFKVAADMESTVVSFGTLLGSAEKAEAMLKSIKATAETTPESFKSLTGAARSLLSVVSEDEMITNLRMIGDLASASQKPIGELASMYAKIKGGDIVQGEDLNQIGDALGGQSLNEFAKVLGVDSVKAVRKMASEGRISGAVMEQVFMNLTQQGGMAFGAMAAQSKTNTGLMSTLKDVLMDVLLTMGMPMGDALKPILQDAIEMVKRLGLGLAGIVEIAKGAIDQGKLGDMVALSLKIGFKEMVNYAVGSFIYLGKFVYRTIGLAFTMVADLLRGGYADALKDMAKGTGLMIAGMARVIVASIGSAFIKVSAYFLAGITSAWNSFRSSISNSWFGEALGLDKVDKRSFTDILAASKDALNLQGNDKAIDAGKQQMMDGAGQIRDGGNDLYEQGMAEFMRKLKSNGSDAYGGLKFEKANLFDTGEDKSLLAKMSKAASFEGWEKVMNAWNNVAVKNEETADKNAENAKRQAEGLAKALADAKAGRAAAKAGLNGKALKDAEGNNFRGVRSMADSLVNRFRQNASDNKGSFADYVSKSAMNTNTVRRFARRNNLSFEEAIAKLGAATKKARLKDAVKKADAAKKKQIANQESMLTVVKQIESHFSKLATT